VCKQETTQPDQTGGQTGQTQDVGYCYDGSRCVYVDSMQGIKSKYPSVCCGADLNSCQGSCVQQQEPGQTDPGKTTEKSISVSVALEEKIECTAGVLNVLAHVKNTGTEALSNVRLITYGENPTTNSFSEYFNLSAGDVKDLNVKIKCSTPLKAFVWKDVNSNGQVDPNERIPVESQPIGVECATLCKNEPAEDTDKTVGNFSLEVTTFEKFTDKDKLEYENYCGKGNINCAKIKIVPKVGQLADFYNDVIQLAFNGGLKAIYGASVQYKNQDYMFFDFSKACASGDKCTYDISLLINNVLQNLENNTGNLECGSKVPSGDDYTGATPKEKLASYYVEYIGFDNTSDNLPAYELPIKLGVKEVNYLSSQSVNNFNKLYVLISQNKFNSLINNSYTIDLYSSYDSSLYTRLIRLINSPISGILQKNNQTYYKYEFADT
ncbi:MAG: hypothetical protein PHO23_02390, partial [Candidatus Pacebacteria bacterium]|nr:hypothetical protein [Candidatus Paceibacterota bacterium]